MARYYPKITRDIDLPAGLDSVTGGSSFTFGLISFVTAPSVQQILRLALQADYFHKVVYMPAQRLWRWPGIETALVRHWLGNDTSLSPLINLHTAISVPPGDWRRTSSRKFLMFCPPWIALITPLPRVINNNRSPDDNITPRIIGCTSKHKTLSKYCCTVGPAS